MKRFATFTSIALSILASSITNVSAIETLGITETFRESNSTLLAAKADTTSQFVTVDGNHNTVGTLKLIEVNGQQYLGWAQEAAVIKPVNYDKKWSLVFKDQYFGVCQESILLHEGSIKILVDGNITIWGKSEDETIIRLQLVELVNVNDKRNILFI